MDTRIITLDMPLPLLAALEDTAHRRAVSLGALVREVLARELAARAGREVAEDDDEDFDVIDRFDVMDLSAASPAKPTPRPDTAPCEAAAQAPV
jgi:hypothetical protein